MSGKPARRRCWLQVSLKTLLVVMLLVCTFFAGRSSRQTEIDRVRMEVEKTRAQSQALQQQMSQRPAVVHWSTYNQWRQRPQWIEIEEGMKADALERSQQLRPQVDPIW